MDRSESMVERVKAAILAKRFEQQGGRFATHDQDDLGLAVAAIEAMREPSVSMTAQTNNEWVEGSEAAAIWRAMIDAALA